MYCLSVNARTQVLLALHWENFKCCWCISRTCIFPPEQTWQLYKTNLRANFKNFKSKIFPTSLVFHFTIVPNLAWPQLCGLFASFQLQSTTHQRPSASISGGQRTSSQTELQQLRLDFTLVSRVEFRSFANHQLDVLSKPNHASTHHHLTHSCSCTPGGS